MAIGLVGLMLSGCGVAATNPPPGARQSAGATQPPAQSQAAPVDSGGGSSLVDAAAKVKDVCALVTADVAAKVVPSAESVLGLTVEFQPPLEYSHQRPLRASAKRWPLAATSISAA